MGDVTRILGRVDSISSLASSELLPLVYDELRRLAAIRMFSESPNNTLQATELVHEAYLRLVKSSQIQPWNSRGHFFAAAAEAMRRILIVERARHKSSLKRGGNLRQIELADFEQCELPPMIDLIALDEALNKLQQKDPRKAELVKLRFFVGLTIQEAAKLLDISSSTADNDWAYAKSWLRVEMSCDEF